MLRKKVPNGVWDYGFVHQAEVLSLITIGKTGRTGIKEVTGNNPDISECLDLYFYDQIFWLDKQKPSTTDQNVILGR